MVNITTPLFAPNYKKNKLIAPSKAGAKKLVGKKNNIISFIKMSASFENETIDKADKQYSIGTKKLNLNQNSKHFEIIFEVL